MEPEMLKQVSGFTAFYFLVRKNKGARFIKHKGWKSNLLFSMVFHVLVLKTSTPLFLARRFVYVQ